MFSSFLASSPCSFLARGKNIIRNPFPLTIFIVVLLVLEASIAYAKEDDRIPAFYLFMPGGTYLYEGDLGEGITFFLSEVSLLTTGILVHDRLETDDRKELNIPFVLAGQFYAIDKWRYFQKSRLRLQQHYPNDPLPIRFDPTPLSNLLFAPFSPKIISSPFVITFALLGVVDGIVAYPRNNKRYSDISTVVALDHQMGRNQGTFYYEGAALGISYGAAVSEEMIFRGLMLPILDAQFGKTTGLMTTSLTFGLLHLFNPDINNPVYFISQATLAGFVLGYHVQHNDYKLSKAIAAHFWYNFASMTVTWITNPKENPLGVGVTFEF